MAAGDGWRHHRKGKTGAAERRPSPRISKPEAEAKHRVARSSPRKECAAHHAGHVAPERLAEPTTKTYRGPVHSWGGPFRSRAVRFWRSGGTPWGCGPWAPSACQRLRAARGVCCLASCCFASPVAACTRGPLTQTPPGPAHLLRLGAWPTRGCESAARAFRSIRTRRGGEGSGRGSRWSG